MKYDMKQRLQMAYHGVDADELENPKQELPPIEQRIAKLKRYLKNDHPRSDHYKKQLEVYQTLLQPEQKKKRKSWLNLWRS